MLVAAEQGRTAVVQLLLQEGHTDAAACDPLGRTALHLAAMGAHTETIKVPNTLPHLCVDNSCSLTHTFRF